jgi:hypothetical protein
MVAKDKLKKSRKRKNKKDFQMKFCFSAANNNNR